MNIGLIGLGKLGLPIAVALSYDHSFGHVIGFDLNPHLMKKQKYPHKEFGIDENNFQELLDTANITFSYSLEDICKACEIIFIAVQTPHLPEYEGITRMPETREDFDYTHLINCVGDLSKHLSKENIVVIISTVLPGTIRGHILPLLKHVCPVVYNPFFIAMGTVIKDFLNPEFVLLGSDDKKALKTVKDFYIKFYGRDLTVEMSIESAELTKVAYNTFISQKIVFANTMMELCDKLPNCNVDDVTNALAKGTDRLLSPKYLQGGMGDGGGCHPRDNIAMSWLAQKLKLRYDIFAENIKAREAQAEYLIDLMLQYDMPKFILGKSFKPETNITTGSPSILCSNILKERDVPFGIFDPHVDNIVNLRLDKAVYLIGTKHNFFKGILFPEGSVIIDPFRYIPDQKNVKVIRVGE